jgi:transglutaminase-like putative cysteine protease
MRWIAFAWLSGLTLPLAAQAPVITPSGDPSVRSDTIYQLAVKPGDYPDQPWVYLLDDGVVVHQADGRSRITYRQVIQILTREGAETWGEQTFSYTAQREKLTVNWVRVLGLDGKVISDGPTHEQETSAPVSQQYPVYTDTKIRRMSLAGVEPGTIVDFSATTEVVEPIMPGSFRNPWRVTTGRPTRRSRLIVDAPASLMLRIQEWNAAPLRQTSVRNGRRTYVWAAKDVPVTEPEPFAGWPNKIQVSLAVSSPTTWDDVARWYTGLARDRYVFGPELRVPLREATANARTREDSLRALHRWVAQDIRYVSLSLGQGGYQPRRPADVVKSKLGDCKDKATLFIVLARRLGFSAYPVLVSLSGEPDSALPAPTAFDHMIVAVEEGGRYRFVDPTADLAPMGDLALELQGEFGLLVRPNGRAERLVLPELPVTTNGTRHLLHGALGADGSFTGRYVERVVGAGAYALRRSMSSAPTMTARDKEGVARALANQLFDGSTGDSLILFDGRDLNVVPEISVWLQAPRAASPSGAEYILTLPLPNYSVSRIAADVESHTPRKFPIDAGSVFGPTSVEWDLEMTVPDGWRAKLPQGVSAQSRFGTYRSTYRQEGDTVKVSRHIAGARGMQPPETARELIAWLRAVAADDSQYLVFETPARER